MCTPNVSVAIYMREHGIKPSDLADLPKPLRSLPKEATKRLARSGVIRRNGRVYEDRAIRVVWAKGKNYNAVIAYPVAHP
jgi:hypothetical protein